MKLEVRVVGQRNPIRLSSVEDSPEDIQRALSDVSDDGLTPIGWALVTDAGDVIEARAIHA